MLIAISGFDYSGKSTQIRALATSNPASVLWSRIGYTPLLIRIKRVARKCMRQSTDVVSASGVGLRRRHRWWIPDLWFWSSLIDYVGFGVWLQFRKLSKTNLILDRYTIDAVVDLSLRMGTSTGRLTCWSLSAGTLFRLPISISS